MQQNQWGQPQYPYGGGGNFQGGGFGQQPTGGNPSFLNSQPTGFMQPMQTGFQQPRPQQSQPTGMTGLGGNLSFLNQPPPQQQQQSFNRPMQNNFTGSSGLQSQMTGFPGGGASGLMAQPTGYPGGGMMSQQTGFGGGLMSQPTGIGGGLRPQPTGFHDPRLQTMMQSFMPSNISQPFGASGAPIFNQTPAQPLTQQFQSLLQNPQVKTPKVPWTLTRQEKKDYDQIFRAWDTDGDGFITGETAIEVFGQSGLAQDDLMKIWNLSDVDNRGKLNLPEFHVAMGLIYRALNGNEIPDKLPEELVPASMRDIDTTVNFMKDLLRHEASTRSNASSPSYGDSRMSAAASKDATMYKHDDSRTGTYKPSSRHIDRKAVRYAGEESDADIKDIRRQLANTSAMLDKSSDDYMRKSEEDEALEQEVDDLKYRVKRLQEDIDYVSKGRRSADKDEERRKLERELLFLMHEKLPELERRQKQREDEKRMEERAGTRARDRRNETQGRFGKYDNERDENDWLRGTYDRDRDRGDRDREREYRRDDRDRDYDRYRDRSRERERDHDRDYRPRSPPRDRTPPPAPAKAPVSTISAPPPAPAVPTTKAAAAPNTKNMTPEERKAYIQEQAQKRIRDRLAALGVSSGAEEEAQPAVDNSVQERLEREKKEAEEKAKTAEKEQEAREEARRKRLEGAGGGPHSPTLSAETLKPAQAPPSPAGPLKSAMKKPAAPPPAPTSRSKAAPPAPIPRSQPSAPSAPAAPSPFSPKTPEEDPEDKALREREEARQKAIADRKARIEAMEREDREAEAKEKALLAARQARSTGASPAATPPVSSPSVAPAAPAVPSGGGYNPFRKPSAGAAAVASTATPAAPSGGGFNPFFKPPSAASPASESVKSPPTEVPAPPAPPMAPPAPFAPPMPKKAPVDDEWEQIQEKDNDSDDSSDDDYASSRAKRGLLASALFGGGSTSSPTGSRPPSAPPAPKAPPAALANIGGGDPNAGRGALLSAIQGGARLKKAQTVEKTAVATGKVIGDAAPPAHIANHAAPPEDDFYDAPSSPVPPHQEAQPKAPASSNPNRQSTDWYAGLAADQSHPAAQFGDSFNKLESTREEEEDSGGMNGHAAPAINVEDEAHGEEDPLADFDMTKSLRVRTLYPYEGQRDVDLTFKENMVIVAHPAKDESGPWWYGMLVDGGRKGWFPHNYVEEMKVTKAKALYTYEGGDDEQLPFVEGDVLEIVDTSDADWWKTEKAGVIFIVPASYLEITDNIAGASGILTTKEIPTVGSDTAPRSIFSPEPTPGAIISPSDSTFLSPLSPTRPRSWTASSNEGYDSDSSDDSVLSFWSSDDDSDDTEIDQAKEAERKRREDERQKMLASAGLKLRREPPGVPMRAERNVSRRRPAPAAPSSKPKKSRRAAPGVPPPRPVSTPESPKTPTSPGPATSPRLELQDAYARYEEFLSQSKTRPAGNRSRAHSHTKITPQLTGQSTLSITSPSASSIHLPHSTRDSTISSNKEGKLTGFLSRIKASGGTTSDRKSTPSISGPIGPITRIDPATISRTDSPAQPGTPISGVPVSLEEPAFGKTWSSLVEPSLLESMSSNERKRQEAIFEFISTEAAYNRDLQLMVEVFFAAMLPILDDKALTVIFANLEDLLLFNTGFLSALEERQKNCRLYIDVIGDVLERFAPNMAVYRTYCVNQSQAVRLLTSLRQSDPKLAMCLQDIRENNTSVRGLDLSSYLLIPMQRITRYPLLIKQIAHYSAPDQDLTQVHTAFAIIESIVSSINESVREADSYERLRVLSEDLWIGGEGRLDLTAPTAYQGPRKLLKEGIVMKAKSGRKLTLVLCNDILVLIESRNLYRMPMPLFEISVRDASRDETGFVVRMDYRRGGGDSVSLKAQSGRDAREWLSMIEKARLRTIDARMNASRKG